jgi:membrane-bound ClpP family serine protease
MVDWITILSLISFGIALLVIEIIVVPGTTVVGLVGFVLMLAGVSLSFRYFGNTIGWTTGTGTAVGTAVILYFCFKSDVWSRFASKAAIDSKVNEGELNDLSVGTEGIAVSALRPFGKAELKGKVYEVKTLGNYMESGKGIRIVEILSHQITVEQIN